MRKAVSKSLYLFLCSILGMILFIMLHRALFVLYGLLLEIDFSTYSFGMSDINILFLDFFSTLLAVFMGGWYGTLLGMDWYAMVYGPNAENSGRYFHSFVPHHWRNGRKKTIQIESKPAVTSTLVKIPVVNRMTEILNTPIVETPPVVQKVREWTFDDLITKPAPAKKTATRKPRKTAARKTTKRTPKAES